MAPEGKLSEEERRCLEATRPPAEELAKVADDERRGEEVARLRRAGREQRAHPPSPPWEYSGHMPDA